MLEALIFDVDGTLAETEELHRRAFNTAFAQAGLGWHWAQADYRGLLTTTGGKERITRFAAEQGLDPARLPVADLHRAKTAAYVALMAQGEIALRPGIADLMDQARAAGVRLAIATTTTPANVEALCRAVFGKPASQVFDVIAAGDEVAAKKPAPDVYLLALHRLGVAADRAVALEDSRNGLRAARAAGLACVVSPGVYSVGEDFSAATRVLSCFSDLGGLAGLVELRP
ncbi:MAG: HAD-IA family hydrolase [Pseudorhodobacter sp.]|nr:HAD-IA family hydrolase [Pseudorhodobacter sp.]